ncbi:hypothetical protein Taro_053187 [Colocasia esculenta]|uniref:Uncharacterized protein n=1 Tax=Colocasia esculenta TaxID=4460 RepID=A0A843XLV1_COLES|nr:hypothetical protein [Colocasia esculenta]
MAKDVAAYRRLEGSFWEASRSLFEEVKGLLRNREEVGSFCKEKKGGFFSKEGCCNCCVLVAPVSFLASEKREKKEEKRSRRRKQGRREKRREEREESLCCLVTCIEKKEERSEGALSHGVSLGGNQVGAVGATLSNSKAVVRRLASPHCRSDGLSRYGRIKCLRGLPNPAPPSRGDGGDARRVRRFSPPFEGRQCCSYSLASDRSLDSLRRASAPGLLRRTPSDGSGSELNRKHLDKLKDVTWVLVLEY